MELNKLKELGFMQAATDSRAPRTKYESFYVSSTAIVFNSAFLKSHKGKYIGIYYNAVTNEIAMHLSPAPQQYYRKVQYSVKSKQFVDIFRNAGYNVKSINVTFDMLTYLDSDHDVIVIKKAGNK